MNSQNLCNFSKNPTIMADQNYFVLKKRKLNNGKIEISKLIVDELKRKQCRFPILSLPNEILQDIFKYLPYQKLCSEIRLVNWQFKQSVEDLLGRTFKNVGEKLKILLKQNERILQTIDDSRQQKYLKKYKKLINLLILYHSIIEATIWRYTDDNHYYQTNKSCMYGGWILDKYQLFFENLNNFKIDKRQLQQLQSIVKNIKILTIKFCNYFERIIELNLKQPLYDSGCKIVDLLNCNLQKNSKIHYQHNHNGVFKAKYSYNFDKSWFITFESLNNRFTNKKQMQNRIHLRLRRLMMASSEYFIEDHLELNNYAKSSVFHGITNSTFCYYGAINNAFLEIYGDSAWSTGITIVVTINCPIQYAPRRFLQNLEIFQRNQQIKNSCVVLDINFPCAENLRLTSTFRYKKFVMRKQ